MPEYPDPQCYKVGAVLLRQQGSDYEVLIVKPQAKTEGYNAPMGLVRGTIKYFDETLSPPQWVDAKRDGEPQPTNVLWEEPFEAMVSEVHEEAGLHPNLLVNQRVFDMDTHIYQTANPEKAPYPIHWYTVLVDEKAQALMPNIGPGQLPDGTIIREPDGTPSPGHFLRDSLRSEWVPLSRMKELAARDYMDTSQDRMAPAYVEMAEHAIAQLKEYRKGAEPKGFTPMKCMAAQLGETSTEHGPHRRY